MSIYDDAAVKVAAAIERLGAQLDVVTGTITSGPSYDPTITETTAGSKALRSSWTSKELSGDLIPITDKKYLFDSSLEIENGMAIIDDGARLEVINVWPIKPGPVLIYQIVQASG